MVAQTGHHLRASRPVVTWLSATALVILGVALAFTAVVTVMVGAAHLALVSLVALVGAVVGFWEMLDRRRR